MTAAEETALKQFQRQYPQLQADSARYMQVTRETGVTRDVYFIYKAGTCIGRVSADYRSIINRCD